MSVKSCLEVTESIIKILIMKCLHVHVNKINMICLYDLNNLFQLWLSRLISQDNSNVFLEVELDLVMDQI